MDSVIHNPNQNRFELEREGLVSVADYRMNGDVLIVTHVGVPEALRGQGLASQLAAAVIEHAREANFKIRPLCSYMAAYMKRHPETADLQA